MSLAGKMLSAVVGSDAIAQEEYPSTSEMKSFIVGKVNELSIVDKREVGAILVMNGRQNDIKYCAQGSIIDLDKLPEDIIVEMYDLIRYKLNNKNAAV